MECDCRGTANSINTIESIEYSKLSGLKGLIYIFIVHNCIVIAIVILIVYQILSRRTLDCKATYLILTVFIYIYIYSRYIFIIIVIIINRGRKNCYLQATCCRSTIYATVSSKLTVEVSVETV